MAPTGRQRSTGHLHAAAESFAVVSSMSQARPKLLVELAEAYYIELPIQMIAGVGPVWTTAFETSITDPASDSGPREQPGTTAPFSGCSTRPPLEAISFINRMLNHAAEVRVEKTHDYIDEPTDRAEPAGIEMDVAGIGHVATSVTATSGPGIGGRASDHTRA